MLRKLKKLESVPSGRQGVKNLTLAQYLEDRFLPGIESKIRLNTFKTYRQAVRNHIVPRMGKAKFALLSPGNVDAWIAELSKDQNVGPRAAQQAFMVLRRAYAYAVDLELIDRNPVAALKAPQARRKQQHILTLDETLRLLDAASKTDWHVLIYLAVATGMRQAELFGLQWKDVHLDRGYLRVVQALGLGAKGEPILTEPKTDASRRRVDLDEEAVTLLQAHHDQQKDNPHDLVFMAERGGFIRKENFRRDVWHPLLKEARLPPITFHSLRHVGNSILAQQGTPLKALQARLGHATSQVTFDVYTHLTPGDLSQAAQKIGSLLSQGGQTRGHNGSGKPRKAKR